ncbi:hypothetical protein Nepgr_027306 [Nepenthes gracilis]|uniref:25S rRNA (uridine-N(3))-methyltransferase BMT5-like domain-containing protein n=1 Tax=Nepenthes gracilis TaxID=150966 RepID=A0AAD3TA52_NEPGR|nr:hypothetical protein Nepgr_027306 [Nepenthes gracilis]
MAAKCIIFLDSFAEDPSTITVDKDSSLPSQEERKFVVLKEKVPPIGDGFGKVEVGLRKEDYIERPRKLQVEEIIRRKGPYTSSQKMLLVGEGDFSFSACLAVSFGTAANMVSTSLDSTEFLFKNYKQAMGNILQLKTRGCTVMHEVDATQMASCHSLNAIKFDRIIFNFPHAGFFVQDVPRDFHIRKHQKLITEFLKNAKKMIAADGQIHITHKTNGFFQEWAIEMLAANEGLRLIEAFHFNHKDYEGYSTKYGFGGDRFFNCNPSKTYIWASAW